MIDIRAKLKHVTSRASSGTPLSPRLPAAGETAGCVGLQKLRLPLTVTPGRGCRLVDP